MKINNLIKHLNYLQSQGTHYPRIEIFADGSWRIGGLVGAGNGRFGDSVESLELLSETILENGEEA